MVTIIAGDRGFSDYQKFCDVLEDFGTDITFVFTMGRSAPNTFGMKWAFHNNLPCREFPQDGKKRMIAEAEDLIYFKKKKTQPNLVKLSRAGGLEVYEHEF